jgi:hypothetical protein
MVHPIVAQLYGVPRGIFFAVFMNLLDENGFQNPQISRKTLRLFPKQSTLDCVLLENFSRN